MQALEGHFSPPKLGSDPHLDDPETKQVDTRTQRVGCLSQSSWHDPGKMEAIWVLGRSLNFQTGPLPPVPSWDLGLGSLWGEGIIRSLWGVNPKALLYGVPEASGVLRKVWLCYAL